MRKQLATFLGALVLAGLLLAACVPAAAPTPTPTKAPVATTAPKPAAATPTVSPKPTTAAPTAKESMDALVAAAKKEGAVTVYISQISPEAIRALSDAFKAAYGITVEWVVTRGSEGLERIATEQATKNYVADIVYIGGSAWPQLKESGRVVSVDLPVAAEAGVWRIHPYEFDPDRKIIAGGNLATVGGFGVLINTKLAPPDKEPKSWLDLLDPFWKGKMIMDDPTISGPGAGLFTQWRAKGIVPKDYFEKLATQEVRLFRGFPQQADMVAKGEYALGIAAQGIYAVPHIQAGLPVKAAWLKEGVYAASMGMSQVINAPHPNAARLLLNWLLTREGQTIWMQNDKSISLRSDVPDYSPDPLKIPAGVPAIRQTYEEYKLGIKDLEEGVAKKIFKK